MKIAVAGATGRLGRHVSEVLAERGHEVVAISRATGVDIITGAGLDAALNEVEVIVDAATGPSPDQQPATEFFVTAAHNLQEASVRAGVRRAVVVSIINIDARPLRRPGQRPAGPGAHRPRRAVPRDPCSGHAGVDLIEHLSATGQGIAPTWSWPRPPRSAAAAGPPPKSRPHRGTPVRSRRQPPTPTPQRCPSRTAPGVRRCGSSRTMLSGSAAGVSSAGRRANAPGGRWL